MYIDSYGYGYACANELEKKSSKVQIANFLYMR